MGNQLVALAPSQIFPVEHYFADLDDVRYETSLGSTRFFKVARARTATGTIVVKVFAIHDPSLPMKSYQDRLNELKRMLAPTFNCLPFQRVLLNDKAGFIIRQYIKYSLYDRLSTRPFLTLIEKKWLAFQLLQAVSQVHGLNACHGDIKLENVMVTSWNWVLLTDFASFKPTYLPEDNPADFSYYFDTSRRRTCYIAPERFKSVGMTLEGAGSLSSQLLPDEEGLTPTMDIFSVGCCLVELFTDGCPPFDFSQLLAYRADEYSPQKVLDKIEDPDIRSMAEHMLQKEPGLRHTVDEYLQQQRGAAFPEYFYSFLQSYMQMFSRAPLMSSDQKVLRIYQDLRHFEKMLEADTPERIDSNCLLILTSVVVACTRSLVLTDSKVSSLKTLAWLSGHLPSDVILDRLLPYVIHEFGSRVAAVQVTAVHTLVTLLGHVTYVPREDANTFPEYILPALLPLCQDPATQVRAALAVNLATVAELALKFLDLVSLVPGQLGEAGPVPSYDTEVSALHELVGQAVTLLLEDPANCVKQMVVQHGATRLAVFFGRQRANDVLLSHMITFLNDKEDSELRFCFYDNIAGVAAFVGWQCSPILKPLLQQGLFDPEELVVSRSISAMAGLAELGLLEKVALFEMLRETAPYLLHPNLWVRQSAVGMVAATASRLDKVDVQVKIGSLLRPYLKSEVIQVEDKALLLSQLKEPIPRAVLEAVARHNQLEAFLTMLEERQTARRITRGSGQQVVYPEMTQQMKQLFIRLAEAGMFPNVEDQLLGLREYIARLASNRTVSGPREVSSVLDCGLSTGEKYVVRLAEDGPRRTSPEPILSMNEEWQHMFGSAEGAAVNTAGQAHDRAVEDGRRGVEQAREGDGGSLVAPCKQGLVQLIMEKRKEFASLAARQESYSRCEEVVDPGRAAWRPRGHLVAHLAEHHGGITRLAAVPDTTLVASASTDGCVRVWDCAKMEGRNIANKARQMYDRHSGTPVVGLASSAHGQILSSASKDGLMAIVNIEKQSLIASRQLDVEEEGQLVDMYFCDLGSSPLLFYCSSFGSILGWDLRKPGVAVRFETDLRQGLTTAFCVSKDESWLAAATSAGTVRTWDLRFQLQVSSFQHPAKSRVRRLEGGARPGTIMASVQGNNEVGVWSIESGSRQQALWASTAPPLASSSSQQSVLAMWVFGHSVVTGGTDTKLRYWDLAMPAESYTIAGDGSSFKSRLVDGTEVLHEVSKGRAKNKEGGRLTVDPSHQDWVTDIVCCQTTQKLLVTGSNDGVMKVWK